MRYFKKINCIVILLVLLFNLLFPIVSVAAETTVTIKFEDANLYNGIVENLTSPSNKIESKNDSTHTIQITQTNLESIDTLHLYDKNIETLNGLEKFVNLTYLALHQNNITNISNLSPLTKLTTLRIFDNNISDISVLNNFKNLQFLEIDNNKITNISVLSNLRNLEYLTLGENNITDISNLNSLTNLKHLTLSGNNITDISSLRNLSNLTELYLGGNNISNITYLENLRNLEHLELAGNNITNINALRNLTNLEYLFLYFNNITDITPLENLVNLKTLNIHHNEITDITTLENLTKLTYINLEDNNITNINALANIENSCRVLISGNNINDLQIVDDNPNININVIPQTLSLTTNKKEVELPQIFIQAQDVNSKLYTSDELILVNCTLNTDKTKVILDDDISEATVTIQGGKISGSRLAINYVDDISPTLTVNYSTSETTNQNVEVTITANERIRQVEGWNLSADGTTLTKEYSSNTTENVTVYDLAGNESTANISINNIDKTVPQIKVSYSTTTATNQNVTATITSNEEMQPVSEWQLSSNKKTLTKEFENNYTGTITVKDLAGNESTANIVINNIDKTAPQVEVSYSTTNPTNQNVEVTITANERIRQLEGWNLSTDGTTLTKQYSANKTETVKVYDLAGNEAAASVSINNIDKEPLTAEISYSTTRPTNQKVIVTITANKAMQNVNGWQLSSSKMILTKEFENNNTENITIQDLAGNTKNLTINVENIDKTLPEVNVSYSNTTITNQNVIVTITSNKKLQEIEGWTLSSDGTTLTKEYSNNKAEKVKVYDLAGNESEANIDIKNIDKVLPQIEVSYSTTKLTNGKVKVTITSNKELQEMEGWQLSSDKKTLTKEFEDNNNQNITIKDLAGNTTEVTIKVQNIDKELPTIEITTKVVGENVIVTITSNKELQEMEGWIISSDRKTLTKEYKKDAKAEKIVIKDLAGNTITKEINPADVKKPTATDDTVAPNKIPQTGQSGWIVGSITVVIVIIAISAIKLKKYKDIK